MLDSRAGEEKGRGEGWALGMMGEGCRAGKRSKPEGGVGEGTFGSSGEVGARERFAKHSSASAQERGGRR